MAWAQVLSRTVAATAGGYALASALPVAVVALWSPERVEGTLISLQMSFVVYLVAALWAFGARSATSAWAGLGLALLASSAVAWAAL